MTARQKRDTRVTGKALSELGPVMSHVNQSLYTSRTNKSESLPSIAGVGLGIQDVRSVGSVPATKTTKSLPIIVKAEKPAKSVVSKGVQVSSNEENLFVSKIEALEKEILLLKTSLKEKDNTVIELNEILKTKTLQFTRDMEHEINDHKTTRQMLERSQRIVNEKEQLLGERIQHYEKVNREVRDQYEETLASLREQSQKEMNIRDERINKLKQQISELFKDKSWEHQKQIEELQKELKRLAEEAHVLRGQLKRHNTSTRCERPLSLLFDVSLILLFPQSAVIWLSSLRRVSLEFSFMRGDRQNCQSARLTDCENNRRQELVVYVLECGKCESLMSALQDSRLQLKLKNRTIEELQSMCQRFQHQLQEQEKLQSVLLEKNSKNQK